MGRERTHRAVSSDGTEIVAHVHGGGRPLVLVSGSGDGQNDPFLLPELSEHFTCYAVSLRGLGLSDANPDQAPERLEQDIAAVVDSVGGPVGVAAHSRPAALALSAVAHTEAAHAVALYEPHVIELYGPEVQEVAECGHFGPWFTPAPIADRIVRFFESGPAST